jgi:hypothetical protein
MGVMGVREFAVGEVCVHKGFICRVHNVLLHNLPRRREGFMWVTRVPWRQK